MINKNRAIIKALKSYKETNISKNKLRIFILPPIKRAGITPAPSMSLLINLSLNELEYLIRVLLGE